MRSERSFNLTFPSISVGSLQGKRMEQTQSWFSWCRDFHMKKGQLPQINILKEGHNVMELDGFRIYNSEKNFRKDWVQVPPFADGKSEHKREGLRDRERERLAFHLYCAFGNHISCESTLCSDVLRCKRGGAQDSILGLLFIKKVSWRTSLVVQWLRLSAANAGGEGQIPGRETKILPASWCDLKIKNK